MSVGVSVEHIGEFCKNSWADQDAVWDVVSFPRNYVLDGAQITPWKGHFF